MRTTFFALQKIRRARGIRTCVIARKELSTWEMVTWARGTTAGSRLSTPLAVSNLRTLFSQRTF